MHKIIEKKKYYRIFLLSLQTKSKYNIDMIESKKQFLKDYIDLHSLDFDMHCLNTFCLDEDIITCEELDEMIYEACYEATCYYMGDDDTVDTDGLDYTCFKHDALSSLDRKIDAFIEERKKLRPKRKTNRKR